MILLDRYIRREVIWATLFVSLVLIAIQSFLMFMQQLHDLGQEQYGLFQVFMYVPMQMPTQFYQLFPIAGFLGCLIGLGRLAQSSQLIVMRASGVSIARIAWSVIKTAVLMIIVVTVIGEGLGPIWQQKSELMRQLALHTISSTGLVQSVWLREDNVFTHIQQIETDTKISGLTRYHFNAQGLMQKATYADAGKLINDQWELQNLKTTDFHKHHTTSYAQSQAHLKLLLNPNLQVQMEMGLTEQSITDLYHTIQYRQSIGLSANQLIFSLWQRIFQPLTSLIMISLGVLFVFGALRSSSMGSRVLMGVILGFGFYMLNQLFGPISLVYQFPPILAAATPTLIFLVIFLALLGRVR